MKKYKIKKTKALIKQLQPYWKEMEDVENRFFNKLIKLEKKMKKETGVEGIEFFHCDGEVVGIGNSSRTMELISFR